MVGSEKKWCCIVNRIFYNNPIYFADLLYVMPDETLAQIQYVTEGEKWAVIKKQKLHCKNVNENENY